MPKCGACNTPILHRPTNAMGKTWHPPCFTCTDCKQILSPDTFLEKGNKPFCDDCYHNRFSQKCAGCKKPIKDVRRYKKLRLIYMNFWGTVLHCIFN